MKLLEETIWETFEIIEAGKDFLNKTPNYWKNSKRNICNNQQMRLHNIAIVRQTLSLLPSESWFLGKRPSRQYKFPRKQTLLTQKSHAREKSKPCAWEKLYISAPDPSVRRPSLHLREWSVRIAASDRKASCLASYCQPWLFV